jgi:hypothetical protein
MIVVVFGYCCWWWQLQQQVRFGQTLLGVFLLVVVQEGQTLTKQQILGGPEPAAVQRHLSAETKWFEGARKSWGCHRHPELEVERIDESRRCPTWEACS